MEIDGLQRLADVVDGECDVVSARKCFPALIGPARRSRFGALPCCMNLYVAELEPQAWEFERGARHLPPVRTGR